MSDRASRHATFVIERELNFAPAFVFAAWTNPQAKAQWFVGGGDWQQDLREMDFRVGGSERLINRWPSGRMSTFDAHYYDIVENERIVYCYQMHLNGVLISVSVATVEFKAAGAGTRLVITEQGVFLDEFTDVAGREHGTKILMDQLARALEAMAG